MKARPENKKTNRTNATRGSFLAGFLGSLTGLGGGVVIAPLLGMALGVDIRYAIGASLRFRHRHFIRRRVGLRFVGGWVFGLKTKVSASAMTRTVSGD